MIGDVVASAVGGALSIFGLDRSERKRNQAAWAESREVVFPGYSAIVPIAMNLEAPSLPLQPL